jgi:hypothetical protein
MELMKKNSIKIGGASGYWGDYSRATEELLNAGGLDFLVYDYLAEVTMSIMARARAKDSAAGYAMDFVHSVLKKNLQCIARQGVKVIANAGGVNPLACAEAIRSLVEEAGLDLKVAVVLGDDLIDHAASINATEMFTGEAFPDPEQIVSVNAYLGAFPIALALDEGANIVITGRCVDSAVTLGACIHTFGWQSEHWDLMSAGTLAGHLIECGTQVTGGNFTDWEAVDSFDTIGYPIAEVNALGEVIISKAKGTGGLVSVGTVAEQMLYEIGDPQSYIVPDVVCDFSSVAISQIGVNRVHVSGAKGYPATDSYKVSTTFKDGWRGGTFFTMYGLDADKKAKLFAENCFKRADSTLALLGLKPYIETSVEILGIESQFGAFRKIETSREVMVKLAARHELPKGVAILLKEITGLALSSPPGLCAFAGTRAKPSPVVRLFSVLIDKATVGITLDFGDRKLTFEPLIVSSEPVIATESFSPAPIDQKIGASVPLIDLAYGRSGDKGDKVNIGIISRRPEYLPFIWSALTEVAVAERFSHFIKTNDRNQSVERFLLPGTHAINFLIHNVLGGGGVVSLRNDAQGKGFAQVLLDHPIPVSEDILKMLMASA